MVIKIYKFKCPKTCSPGEARVSDVDAALLKEELHPCEQLGPSVDPEQHQALGAQYELGLAAA